MWTELSPELGPNRDRIETELGPNWDRIGTELTQLLLKHGIYCKNSIYYLFLFKFNDLGTGLGHAFGYHFGPCTLGSFFVVWVNVCSRSSPVVPLRPSPSPSRVVLAALAQPFLSSRPVGSVSVSVPCRPGCACAAVFLGSCAGSSVLMIYDIT